MESIKTQVLILCCLALGAVSCYETPSPLKVDVSGNEAYEKRGEYLVNSLAWCGFCHSPERKPFGLLSGGVKLLDVYGEVLSPNITPDYKTGIGTFSLDQIVTAVRDSVSPGNRRFSPEFHAGYEWLSEIDALSIAAYLKSLDGVSRYIPKREIGFFDRNLKGFFRRSAREIPGYVPEVSENDRVEYGRYLVDHVARCGLCHTSEGGIFGGERYLGGANVTLFAGKSFFAPPINSSRFSSWSDEDILKFFRTGITPKKTTVDKKLCPIGFIALASDRDLEAIAQYLKSGS
ncbi:MAG: hypothetical protein D6808_05610 [Candidatus Dadabacteria bacterium]|nr:MAG: hypothetical protein D6808_05610 [Candidatus Dadabacteria bacterium]